MEGDSGGHSLERHAQSNSVSDDDERSCREEICLLTFDFIAQFSRADMLRYLLIILDGGTWSDMDTVPLQHFSSWSSNAIPFARHYSERLASSSTAAAQMGRFKESESRTDSLSNDNRQPIRAVVSIECAPRWFSLRGL